MVKMVTRTLLNLTLFYITCIVSVLSGENETVI